jgi:hypothetical protein
VKYFGAEAAEITVAATIMTAAALAQTMRLILFFGTRTAADLNVDGLGWNIAQASLNQTRILYYGSNANDVPASDADVINYVAAYGSLGMSTDFTGSKTTSTQQLKGLTGVLPDSSMTQTLYGLAQAAGVDVYPTIDLVAKLLTSNANTFFDRVYNSLAFAGDLAIAAFNTLATVATKIPQTEDGMRLMKSATRQVCIQYKGNLYIAPGSWTSPTTFGNQADFLRNIADQGYYIYTPPIADQDEVDREDRVAPLQQVAVKEAGAIHSAAIQININP